MVKVQKRLAFKRKDQAYFKHMVTIPESAFKALKWKDGQHLEATVETAQSQLVFTAVETKPKPKKRHWIL